MAEVKIPKGEVLWVSYFNRSGKLIFILTSKPARDKYFLYAVNDGKIEKLGGSPSPTKLEETYRVHERMEESS